MKVLKKIILALLDAFLITVAWIIALAVSSNDIAQCLANTWYYLLIAIVISCPINAIFGLYNKLLQFIDFSDAVKTVCAGIFTCLYFTFVAIFVKADYTLSWLLIAAMIYMLALCTSRCSYRLYATLLTYRKNVSDKKTGVRVAIIGAGSAGSMLIREMKNSDKLSMNPVCVVDDDEKKRGQEINGVKVVGNTGEIQEIVKKYAIQEIIVAMPSVDKKSLKRILESCQDTKCVVKNLPGAYQFATGQVSVASIKPVSITDLLGREQVKVNINEIIGYIEGKTVLVTGGGGSIGSELCRQIAAHNPKELIIFDIYENNAYEIQQELKRNYANLNLTVLVGSVRDSKRVNNVFQKYKPNIVFHAAAHKHVPLMETSPNEAVKNNVSGTYKVAEAAGVNGAEKFILISTDKAVNPTNIMGATKRVCEMIIQTINKRHNTNYVAVRFGNVLGSNGSVIPLFTKQIAEGGPVTVTDKNIVRYFMTIPEAVSLVLQAGAYANGGEIFVLDMGEPVRIYDLAEKMIKLSGFTPNKDIEIKVVGLRPGEKLYEERLMEEEGLAKTANDMISIGKPLEIDEENLFKKIQELYVEAYNETDKMKELVHELVSTYKIDKRS